MQRFFLIVSIFFWYQSYLYAAHAAAAPSPTPAPAPAVSAGESATLSNVQHMQQKQTDQLTHQLQCAQFLQQGYAHATANLTPAERAQMAAGPTYFFPARVLGAALQSNWQQQHTDHGSFDQATLAQMAELRAIIQNHLTGAGHPQGLATTHELNKVEQAVLKLQASVDALPDKVADACAKKVEAAVANAITAHVPAWMGKPASVKKSQSYFSSRLRHAHGGSGKDESDKYSVLSSLNGGSRKKATGDSSSTNSCIIS
jgi:hypothetical protein